MIWLFLDDSDERHIEFRKMLAECNVSIVHAWTAAEAVKLLSENRYDRVFLDHDLENTDPDSTGYAVAEYIALHQLPALQPRNIVIHSHNPEGAKNMQRVLEENGLTAFLVPFGI